MARRREHPQPDTAVISPPPEPVPQSLAEFLARHVTMTAGIRGEEIPAARYTTDLVTAAAEGREAPSLAALSGRDKYAVVELLDDLIGRSREYPAATSLLVRARREYHDRVEIRIRQGLPPVAVARSLPGASFRPNPAAMTLSADEVSKLLGEVASTGISAVAFLRAVAAGLRGGAVQADAAGLDSCSRAAVTGLLEAGKRTQQEQGNHSHAQALGLILGEWRAWASAHQESGADREAPAAPPAA
jgi:hypothetical protein